MRKLERQMNFALSNKANWAGSNTQVNYNSNTNCSSVYLHGHQIATLDHSTNALKIDSCGYQTVTTKSRLNAILEEVNTVAEYSKSSGIGSLVTTIQPNLSLME